jgi:two-component system, NtrC family, sensor histidine kinase KinB
MSQSDTIAKLVDKNNTGRLHVLYAVYEMLKQAEADGLDMNVILPRILQLAMQQLKAPSGSIIVVNPQYQLEYAWLIDDHNRHSTYHPYLERVISDGLAGWVLRHQQAVTIDNTLVDARWLADSDDAAQNKSQPWSVISAPMVTRSRPIGAITITKPGEKRFDQDDANLLMVLASQASSTVENARLYEESQRRTAELSALVEATTAVSSSLEMRQVVRMVPKQMVGLLKVAASALLRWDNMTGRLSVWGEYSQAGELPVERPDNSLDLENYHLARYVLEHSQATQFQADNTDISRLERQLLAAYEAESMLLIPLTAQDQTIGLVELMSRELRTFSAQDISLVQLLANEAAIAIENARLYQETQHQLRVSNLLNQASHVINSSLDINEIMQLMLAQMNELLKVEALSIALVDEQSRELVYEVAEGMGSEKIVGLRMPSNEGVSGWVMERGQPALVPDTRLDDRFSGLGDQRTGYNTRAIICAPLMVKGEVLGTIQALNPIEGMFTEQDLQLLVNLANLASSAVANAKQFARIQAAEARYLGLFEDSINPIILSDLAGRIVEANHAAHQFLGYDREELLRMSIHDLHPEDGELGRSQLSVIDWEQVRVFSSHAITKDQRRIPVAVHAKQIITGNNTLMQWIHQDISKQVELEEMREDLMAMLFHDLQSPLGNVIASLDLLAHELPPDTTPMINSIVDIASRSSRRLQTLIRSLLDINRLEAGHPISERQQVQAADLVNAAIETIVPVLERREIELEKSVPNDLPELYVDEDMIRRVLINLLENALKFSPDQSRITVAASWQPDAPWITFSITDQGTGIPEQYREVIFEKFRRVQEYEGGPKGLGLGLAFCRLAVVAHGGQIWVRSAKPEGAKFSFTLPVV